MRRTGAIVVVAASLLAACSSHAGVSVVTDPSDRIETGGTGADVPGAIDEVRTPADDLSLPGLLDASDEPVPDDDAVRTGTLANGLRYYVRANDNPGGKAELRLAVDAGSVDEIDSSTGIAHFVEHMLFNGTERYPENELIDVLRGFGAAFGADINASTSYDETVYALTVPSGDESLETGLSVLEQWLSHATFEPGQVVAERGVVLDEWRVRTQSAGGRLFEVAADLFLAGTPYQDRPPIGSEESIATMEAEELRAFYDAWYRPDNASVVVVGDIVVADVVGDIERLFGPANPRTTMPPARPDTTFVVDTEPGFGLHADPDQRTVDVEVTLPLPTFESDGNAAARATFLDLMVFEVLVRRLDQDLATGQAPFDRIAKGGNSFVAGLDAPALYAVTDVERVNETLQALLDEYERADRFGFTADETDVSRETLRSVFQSRFDGRDTTQDAEYADTYVDDFLSGGGYPAIEDEYRLATAILDSVTPEAMNLRFRARWANSAPHVIISAPAGLSDRMPTRADVVTTIDALESRAIVSRTPSRALPDELMERPEPTAPGSVEELIVFDDPFFDPIEIEYPNGVRVILNSNQIVDGQVFFQALSPGGSSLVSDDDVVDALFATDIVTTSGVGDYNQAELSQIMAGRDVRVDAWVTPYLENLAGSAATGDLEVLLQLVHLYMTRPRYDAVALSQVRGRIGPLVADPASDPVAAADDALLDARYPGELRYASLPTPDQFATLDLAGVERVWTNRFGNAADWVFVFSGDLDLGVTADLANAYLGSLPGGIDEQWVDLDRPPPDGVVRTTVRAGTGATASVTMLFTSPVETVDAELRVNADVVTEVVSGRLTDELRERLGESYSPMAVSSLTTDPDPVIETLVSVTGAPDRVEQIAEIVVAELEDLGTNGPTDQEFRNAFVQVEEGLNFVNNGDFLAALLDDAIHPDLELDDYLLEFAALDSVLVESVRDFIGAHISTDHYIQVIVSPR